MSKKSAELTARLSQLLQVIAPPARLEILLALGDGEACVCHLEALTSYRQAYISQHLMALRDAGVIAARREGRYVYYRLQDQAFLGFLKSAGKLCGFTQGDLDWAASGSPVVGCDCPHCTAAGYSPLLQIGMPESAV